jgi:hypothetical protein
MSDLARYLAGDNYLTRSASGIKRGLSALADSLTARSNEGIENMGAALSGVRVRPGAILTDAGYVMSDASGQPDFTQVGLDREPDTLRLLELFGSAMTPVKGASVAAKSGAGGKVAADAVRALPMDEASRMARAAEMGFHTDLYHGTGSDVQSFDKRLFGSSTKAAGANKAVWLVDDPRTATGYAEYAAGKPVRDALEKSETYERLAHKTGDNHWWDKQDEAVRMAEEIEASGLSGQNVMPLMARGNLMSHDFSGAEYTDVAKDVARLLREAQAGGYDGLKLLNLADDVALNGRPATHYAIFDPKNIRSRFAAFDPSQAQSADLLASRANLGPIVNALLQGYDRQ